ncbi:MAG: LytTR family DNA-binding domain-containing protein [Anaerovoracaceae bacterium]|nr:LytTR family DNA-binding domain-containing protein [Anaerovoracaceae bacterium]
MKIAICDDNINVSRNLYDLLLKIDALHISKIDIYTDAESLIFKVEENTYDMIFMDIQLNSCSGIDASKEILGIAPYTHIVFMSGYDDYYLDVYEVDHIYFLRKPIDFDKLCSAVKISQNKRLYRKRNFFTINDKHGIVRVPMENIIFFEKNLRIIEIHMNTSYEFKNAVYDAEFNEYKYSFYGKLSDILPDLSGAFHQCHNSFIINYNYVSEITGSSFILNNKRTIPISKKYSQNIKCSFFDYVDL